MKKLRFAPFIRVSTEKQEQQGESLRTQRKQIIQAVNELGGVIPDECWVYSGQEHATPEFEKRMFDQLLSDSSTDQFDAVIVAHPDRWSRDTVAGIEGLNVLAKNNIRFFVLKTEHSLNDEQARMFLAFNTVIGEYVAKTQSRKSIEARIERAKRGIPTAGNLPHGREFKNGKIVTIEDDRARIIEAAKLYLNGMSNTKIAEMFGMNASNLWKILTKRSGTHWESVFKGEKIAFEMEPLLDEITIEKIKQKAKARKTYSRGKSKYNYLLSGKIKCAECGYTMFGQANHSGKIYYRHARGRKKFCSANTYISGRKIENAVMVHLYSTFGNEAALEEALDQAIPNREKIIELQSSKKVLEHRKFELQKKLERLVDAIADGTIAGNAINTRINEFERQEEAISTEIDEINRQLNNFPSEELRREKANSMRTAWQKFNVRRKYSSYEHFLEMPYEDKRALIKKVFDGDDPEGNPLSVYVSKEDGVWSYTIKGIAIDISDVLGMSIHEANILLGVPTILDVIEDGEAHKNIKPEDDFFLVDFSPFVNEGNERTQGRTDGAMS